jgi:DNA-binding response OmpR family regulator
MVEKRRVVMVDDNKALTRFICSLLRDQGYDVVCLNTLENAEEFFSTCVDDIHAVLLDYTIGNKKGDSLAKTIRNKFPQSRIILVSGCPPKELIHIETLLVDRVIDAFVEKPFSFDKIEQCLQ